ncbi:MAG: glycosyltransferase family 2 protein [Pirellulaceae bacterium]|nr:glycosyltransferase family 2 protein [Pirellulaceae bacterium]
MTTLLIALMIILAVSWAAQFVLVAGFVTRLKRWHVPLVSDPEAPPALVILCLRGGDPFLMRCIEGLVTQDYPNYRICFMVDHANDPSVPVLRASLLTHGFANYEILTLERPLSTCSLKCSSLVQAIESINSREAIEIIALLDADTVPHASWLRELATALQPADVGASTGNRWYMPDQISAGTLTRCLWNAAAVVQMYWYEIAWGGTLAIKLSSIEKAGLLDRWRSALCEDTMLRRQLASIQQRVAFVPSLMMVNREDCTLRTLVPWMRRQLLTARLYHPLWMAVVGHGISSALLQLWGWSMCLIWLAQGYIGYGLVTGASMLLFQFGLTILLPWMESAVSRIVQARGEGTDWRRQVSWWQMASAVYLTQWVYTWALVSCLLVREVEWRGIKYRTLGPWRIEMLAYQPYQASSAQGLESL